MRTGRRLLALGYLGVILVAPVVVVVWKTFEPGLGAVWASVTTPAAIHAFWLTIEVTLIAVPLNAAFGVIAALVLVRSRVRGRRILEALIDLPFAISPVVVGLSLLLLYGREGWFGHDLADAGIQIIFSVPGIVLATIFVTLPFVVREVAPVLREVGDEQEQAAATLGASRWQTFRRITLPAIRTALLAGALLAFALSFDEIIVTNFTAGASVQTLPIWIFTNYQRPNNLPLVNVAAVFVLVLSIVPVYLASRLTSGVETTGR
jgi:sulfate/thiosulfate transport system permease protein